MTNTIQTFNPSTGKPLGNYPLDTDEVVHKKLHAAQPGFADWSLRTVEERGKHLRRLAAAMRERESILAEAMAEEMGKPLAQGRAEVEKCATCCEFFAANAASFLAPEHIATEARSSYVAFQPLGGILAIMPWNFPLWQVIRFAAPALMAGNVIALKHAPSTLGYGITIENLGRIAGFPDGVLQNFLVDVAQVEGIIKHPAIHAVAFTGSSRAGAQVAAQAGAALKKCVLELGGSDPYIVLDDADVPAAVRHCVTARTLNSGQSCIAAKRFIVTPAAREEFERLFVEQMNAKTFGNPLLGSFDLGPIAREDLRATLHQQVEQSIAQGATLLAGGFIPEGDGWFYPPTAISNVRRGMAAYSEELFGPVAAIIHATDEDDAIRIANDTAFGLGAAVFTRNVGRGEMIARERIHAGFCAVNESVRSDVRLPFGGIKSSGYGRELSAFGIREFVNIKTVFVQS